MYGCGDWDVVSMRDEFGAQGVAFPTQLNGVDCGVFMLEFARCVLQEQVPRFTQVCVCALCACVCACVSLTPRGLLCVAQADIPYMRRRLGLEILTDVVTL